MTMKLESSLIVHMTSSFPYAQCLPCVIHPFQLEVGL
jgi:hypothetical protein